MTPALDRAPRISTVGIGALAPGLLIAIVIRVLLLPTPGLPDDLDQFVAWVHGLTTAPFGNAFDQNPTFGPVMMYVWGALAALEPAFRTATTSADAGIRALMKTPASLADLGLAIGVFYALRSRPWWATAAALGIAFHPAVIDISAWWGQYESVYALFALGAYLFAINERPTLAAALLAVALLTKPQAIPFLVPFAAWFLARYGRRGAVRYALVALVVIALLWAPFVAAGGPLAYLRNLGTYQDIFGVLSLRAWNPWWLVQEAFGHGEFIADTQPIAGPLTLRVVGYGLTILLEAVVFLAVLRGPTPRTLALGLAAATLVGFLALTTMHERYAFAGLIFLTLLIRDRRALALWIGLGIVFTLNLLAAVPPTPEIGDLLPVGGTLGIVGSVAMTAIGGGVVALLMAARSEEAAL